MGTSPRFFLAIALVTAVVSLFAQPARADKRIAVLEIEGARTPRLRKEIVRVIRPHDSMSAQAYRNAARRLRAVKLTPNNVAEVAKYLGADGVLDGTLVAEDGGYVLTLRLRSGKEGLIVKRVGMRLSEPRLSKKMARGLRKRLLPAIADLPSLDGGDDPGPVADGPTEGSFLDEDERREREAAERRETARERRRRERRERRERAEREREERRERARAEREERRERRERAARERRRERDEDERRRDDEDREPPPDDELLEDDEALEDDDRVAEVRTEDDENPIAGDDADAEVEAEAKDEVARTARERPLTFLAGVSVSQRSLQFSVAAGLENPPLGYQGSAVPGAHLRGDVYPMAFGDDRGLLGNLGLSFVFDQVLKINSAVENPDTGMAEIIPTKQQRWSVGASYRMNFGDEETSPQLVLGLGYGRTKFLLDKGAASEGLVVDVPNVDYTYVDPGMRFRIGVVDNAYFYAEGRFLLVLNTGEMQQPEQYGTARVIGYDADAGLEYLISDRYLVRAGGHLHGYGFTFQGNGNQTDRNGDGTIDVGGAADRYLGGYLLGGFTF